MNVVLHGFLHGANFGDLLFAHLFYRACQSAGCGAVDFWQTPWYGIGERCRKEIGYETRKGLFSCLRADAFVLISGGCFGYGEEDRVRRWKKRMCLHLKRYMRFVLPARIFQLMGKPVYVLGVGGGPLAPSWFRAALVRMLNRAAVIHVRDEETGRCLVAYGVKVPVRVTTDTANVIDGRMVPELVDGAALEAFAAGRRLMFVHLDPRGFLNDRFVENVLPGLLAFLDGHTEYAVAVGFDDYCGGDAESNLRGQEAVHLLQRRHKVFFFDYCDCWQMCAFLNRVDFVVTTKLHVGVLAAALGKSVLSFPLVFEKTARYYRQIGEIDRCRPLQAVTPEDVRMLCERYHNRPVELSLGIRAAARQNFEALNDLFARSSAQSVADDAKVV